MSLSWPGTSRPGGLRGEMPPGPPGMGRPSPPADDRFPFLRAPRRVWRGLPLRVQLVAVVITLVMLALAITGAASAAILRGQLMNRVDDQLQSSMAAIVGPVKGNARTFGAQPSLPQTGSAFFACLYDADGDVLSGPLLLVPAGQQQSGPRLPQLTYGVAQSNQGDPFTAPAVSDQNDWRVLVQPVLINGSPVVIAVALNLRDAQATLHQLIGIEVVVGLIVLLLLAFVGYAVVRTSLRGLVTVEQTAGAIAAGDLSRRVPVEDSRTEVGRLGIALNAMLTQVERAFRDRQASEANARASEERMRRFVADASHELRTPLTSIRGFAELHRQGAAADPEAVSRVLGRIESEAQRMGLLVDDLLLLARLDQQRPLEHKPVDLLTLAADAVADVGAIEPERPVRLVTGSLGETPPVVTGDEARLRQVLSNLLSNALRYTPPGSPIEVRVGLDGSEALLQVIDSGPGMAPEDAERIFERFYRADPSRTRSGSATGAAAPGGSGLGLSIVAALVAAHGGRVSVRTAPGQGATFTVRLPLREPAAAEANS